MCSSGCGCGCGAVSTTGTSTRRSCLCIVAVRLFSRERAIYLLPPLGVPAFAQAVRFFSSLSLSPHARQARTAALQGHVCTVPGPANAATGPLSRRRRRQRCPGASLISLLPPLHPRRGGGADDHATQSERSNLLRGAQGGGLASYSMHENLRRAISTETGRDCTGLVAVFACVPVLSLCAAVRAGS